MLVILLLLISLSGNSQLWQNDFEKAKDLAEAENKTLILVFSGSDWCAPCMKLEREIWNAEEFQEYAKAHYVMYKADFPRKRQNKPDAETELKNKALAEKFNTKGFFPLVVVFNADAEVLGETGYNKMSVADYIKHLDSFEN